MAPYLVYNLVTILNSTLRFSKVSSRKLARLYFREKFVTRNGQFHTQTCQSSVTPASHGVFFISAKFDNNSFGVQYHRHKVFGAFCNRPFLCESHLFLYPLRVDRFTAAILRQTRGFQYNAPRLLLLLLK